LQEKHICFVGHSRYISGDGGRILFYRKAKSLASEIQSSCLLLMLPSMPMVVC
jgi:hypothetical protein